MRGVAQRGTTILLVTHHVDEIIPEIERVILLQHGRVAADGPKAAVLTAEHLGRAFDAPLVVDRSWRLLPRPGGPLIAASAAFSA